MHEAQCTILLLEQVDSSLTTIMHELGQSSKYISIRLVGGLGRVLENSQYESLYEQYRHEYQVFSLVDKSVRNRELEPNTTIQVIRQNRDRLESVWEESSLAEFFTVYGCPSRSTLHNPLEALDTYITWFSNILSLEDSGDGVLKRRQVVQRALDLLAVQFTQEIGLAQVADMLGITPNYLSTEFNRAMGESFPQYVTRMRMEKADSLLKTGRYTVKDVASQVGYVSSRHFGKLFKKYFGHVPSEHPIFEP
jgi:AraC-like DNA-binding protein